MDLATMKSKAKGGKYKGWDDLQYDFDIMFSNAMAYNGEDTVFYRMAVRLKNTARKLVKLSK